jgi:hypothetical protein
MPITARHRPFGIGSSMRQCPSGGDAMFREITEVVGPIALEIVATVACLTVFVPLVVALIAPIFS